MMNRRPIMKPAAPPQSSLAHPAASNTVPANKVANNAQSTTNSATAAAVRRATSGANHPRITLRCGMAALGATGCSGPTLAGVLEAGVAGERLSAGVYIVGPRNTMVGY